MAGQQASNPSYPNMHTQDQLMGRSLQENQLFQQQQQQNQLQSLQHQSMLHDMQLQQQPMFQPLQNMPSQQAGIDSPTQQDLFPQGTNPLGPTQNSGGMPPSPFYGNMSLPSNQGFLNRANLQFEGNLEDMMVNWSEDEKTSSRRLVQFWRRHENNTIYSRFQAISPADRSPNSIVISCIYWREKGHYVVTSVDCILLLEALIAVRFTVEEKNRIRRNLEGFRPLTIAKCKTDTADFFRLIMAFPNPKPRNIEKDVKVFPWRILSFALQKIVSKYAAGFTPSFGMGMNSFGGMSNLSSGMPSPAGPHHRMDSSPFFGGYPVRANMQRRFSQPVNSMSMGRFHPYGMGGPPPNRFASNFSSRHGSISEMPEEFSLKEEPDFGARPMQGQAGNINPAIHDDTSLASLNLETNFTQNFVPPFQERHNMSFDNDFFGQGSSIPSYRQGANPRRHSLADPYSLQRFQAMRLGINPMAMSSTGEEPPSGFEFGSNQGLGSLNNNSAFTIKEEEEFPPSNDNNPSLMNHASSSDPRMRPNGNFYGGNMGNCNDSNMPDSMAFLGNQGFGQLPQGGVYGNINGMPYNMQTTSGEDSQIPPTYNS